ncbi:thioredoxin domain-containing protein [Aestuariimicrobium sp. p3-SID1156]|uniref:thioredoxin domain-containing protein n=1 Tax=Aestuariimicrobium sp. p3-SID1156 TaxID=2916038 RepID=UPI00223C26E2|nr:thioredoxin domain-containing protein [Aestuariimicrobium sp. p3-SID1156]MCT1458842.1 thioredoxin domain-containing protein [Aestuariimicrobium sp. p3-SID1156]
MPNRLADATSPYLLQHAHQPVDWWPWGEDAFEEARRRDVPIFLSVGYAACHWCHVMAHESFDNPEIAQFLNDNFVSIKVDREEHPDVDAVYMNATQAMTGRGGWPMSVFLTPEGVPFFAGTYFPPVAGGGMPGFGDVCQALSQAWQERREEVVGSAGQIREQLAELNQVPTAADKAPTALDTLEKLGESYDMVHGGFGAAPKFPPSMLLDALLVKGDPTSLDMAQLTCETMARGGIHDQLAGGFHRYSVDAGWVVPHFEKMLYDNALLLGTYTRAWRRTADHDPDKRALFERVIFGIVDWLREEMTTENGGLASSLDADSADIRGAVHEGIFYVWNPELLTDALGEEDAEFAQKVFHVTSGGTFEHGFSTLQLRTVSDWERLERVIARLKEVRAGRFRPARDDKVVAVWNGLAIDSLVTAGMVFNQPEWVEMARRAAEAVWTVHRVEVEGVPTLRRTSRDGVPGESPAVTEDFGALALGFTRLAGALGDAQWLERAMWLVDQAEELFSSEDGGFHDAAEDELRFARPRDLTDNATPSGTATMVAALRAVSLLSGEQRYMERADQAARTTWSTTAAMPRFAGWSLADALVMEEARRGLRPAYVTIVVDEGDQLNQLVRAAWRMAPAGTALVAGPVGTQGFGHLFEGRGQIDDSATAYVCRGMTCFEPVTSYEELKTPLWSRC